MIAIIAPMLVLSGAAAIADESQRLRQYQWIETTQITWRGAARPSSRLLCRYGPDGRVQKIPTGPIPEPLADTEEMEDRLREVQAVIGAYLALDEHEIERAYRAQTVSVHPTAGVKDLIFKDHVRPGDRMALRFDPESRKIVSLHINTDMGPDKGAVSFWVLMDSLPDGTSYVRQTFLTASRMQLEATTTNSRYRILGLAN
jgi:hypothetical protein